jgi:hypothetical protein
MRWKTFLKAHWELMAAADFFTVEVPSARGLVRYSVFFVMKLKTRTVHITGISPTPTGEWMKQLARNLTDIEDGFLSGIKYLIQRRGSKRSLAGLHATGASLPSSSPAGPPVDQPPYCWPGLPEADDGYV